MAAVEVIRKMAAMEVRRNHDLSHAGRQAPGMPGTASRRRKPLPLEGLQSQAAKDRSADYESDSDDMMGLPRQV